MEPLVRIENNGQIRSAKLMVGNAKIPLSREMQDEAVPSRWVIPTSDESSWNALGWVINLAVDGTRPDLLPGILEGVSAGRGVFIDPLESLDRRPELVERWVRVTGLEPGPHPMVVGTTFIVEELLVPLDYLRAIYDLLRTQMAPSRPSPTE